MSDTDDRPPEDAQNPGNTFVHGRSGDVLHETPDPEGDRTPPPSKNETEPGDDPEDRPAEDEPPVDAPTGDVTDGEGGR